MKPNQLPTHRIDKTELIKASADPNSSRNVSAVWLSYTAIAALGPNIFNRKSEKWHTFMESRTPVDRREE